MNTGKMPDDCFLILKVKKTKALRVALVVFIASVFLFNLLFLEARADMIAQELQVAASQLMDKHAFKENEQLTVSVYPHSNNGSTNIAFYAECPAVACPDNGTLESPEFIFFAENQGHGRLPFSDYWAPDPSFHKLVAVEYFNDEQQFTCSDLSLNDCIADYHFISQFSFEISGNDIIDSAPIVATSTAVSTVETIVSALNVGDYASSTALIENVSPISQEPAVNSDAADSAVSIIQDTAPTQAQDMDVIDGGAMPDNNSVLVAPLPDSEPAVPAPILQEDKSTTPEDI